MAVNNMFRGRVSALGASRHAQIFLMRIAAMMSHFSKRTKPLSAGTVPFRKRPACRKSLRKAIISHHSTAS
jgi:hypothetical protein